MAKTFEIGPATQRDWPEVAELIYDSTNAWYQQNRGFTLFSGPKSCALLFCETYAALDGVENLILARDVAAGRIAGSCFFHPRKTHASLGIMNVHPDYFGQGVAPQILGRLVSMADALRLPLRLVSSAMNLDSFSLYNRFGFVPYALFQDMMIRDFDPGRGVVPAAVSALEGRVRRARMDDVPAITRLERECVGIERPDDFRHFIANPNGAWGMWVLEGQDGALDGALASVVHPGSCMIGPGVMRSEDQMLAMLRVVLGELSAQGASPVFLIPANCVSAARLLYDWGARNTEIHMAQCLGEVTPPTGIMMPSFMPESA